MKARGIDFGGFEGAALVRPQLDALGQPVSSLGSARVEMGLVFSWLLGRKETVLPDVAGETQVSVKPDARSSRTNLLSVLGFFFFLLK